MEIAIVGITIKPEIVDLVEYKILDGANQKYDSTGDKDLVFRADGKVEDLQEIQVDNKKVDKENYTIESGSTILTLKSSHIKTLESGNHTLTFVYDDGSVSTNFTVENTKVDNPQTGDNIYIYVILFIISCFGISIGTLKLKKMNI